MMVGIYFLKLYLKWKIILGSFLKNTLNTLRTVAPAIALCLILLPDPDRRFRFDESGLQSSAYGRLRDSRRVKGNERGFSSSR